MQNFRERLINIHRPVSVFYGLEGEAILCYARSHSFTDTVSHLSLQNLEAPENLDSVLVKEAWNPEGVSGSKS